jgi:hypothetical protein
MTQTMNNKLVTPAEIQWGPGPAVLPAGAQGAVLYGDPTKDGLFSMRFKLPNGYRVPPHTLSKSGLFTVISGTFRIAGWARRPIRARRKRCRQEASSRLRDYEDPGSENQLGVR